MERTHIAFTSFMIPSYDYYYSNMNEESIAFQLWVEIWYDCYEKLLNDRIYNPIYIINELILFCENWFITKTGKNWYEEDYFKELKTTFTKYVNSDRQPYLKSYEFYISNLRNFSQEKEELNKSINYFYQLLKSFLNRISINTIYLAKLKELKDYLTSSKLKDLTDFSALMELVIEIQILLTLSNYSLEFVQKMFDLFFSGSYEKLPAEEVILTKLERITFKDEIYIVDLIYEGYLSLPNQDDVPKDDIIKFENGIILFNESSKSFIEDRNQFFIPINEIKQNFIGVHIEIMAKDKVSAINTAKESFQEIFNLASIYDPRPLVMKSAFVKLKANNNHSSKNFNTDPMIVKGYMIKSGFSTQERLNTLKVKERNRILEFLKKMNQLDGAISEEEKILDLWVALEVLLGGIDPSRENSTIILFYSSICYSVAKLNWYESVIISKLSNQSNELKLLLFTIAKENSLKHEGQITFSILYKNKARIEPLIKSPFVKILFSKLCLLTNKEKKELLQQYNKDVKNDLLTIRSIRNSIVHGRSNIPHINLSLVREKLRVITKSSFSMLLNMLLITKCSIEESLVILQEFYNKILYELENNPSFDLHFDLDQLFKSY